METVLVPMLLRILSTSSSSSRLAISSLVMAEPLMMAAGVRGNWGRELAPWFASKGLPASSSGYLGTGLEVHSLFLFLKFVPLFTSFTNQEVSLFFIRFKMLLSLPLALELVHSIVPCDLIVVHNVPGKYSSLSFIWSKKIYINIYVCTVPKGAHPGGVSISVFLLLLPCLALPVVVNMPEGSSPGVLLLHLWHVEIVNDN